MSYYFAYGSNLDLQQMKRRCPHAKEVGTATLYGWGLRFVGWSHGWNGSVADVVREHGGVTVGALYELPYAELTDRMDRYEGAPRCYKRIRINVRLASGRAVRAWTYVKVSNTDRGVPSAEYFAAIWYGYESRGLDLQLLLDAVCYSGAAILEADDGCAGVDAQRALFR